jgi:thioredoxin 1
MGVTLMDFYADWCGPCKTQDPILEELMDDWRDRVDLEKINVDEQQDIANDYQVRSLPTLIVEDDDGVVERFVGVTQRDDIERVLEEATA